MLKIWLGDNPEREISPDDWLRNAAPDGMLVQDFAKRVIKEIDGSDVLGEQLVMSPILGPIPPDKISGGAKAILFMQYGQEEGDDGWIVNLEKCGENCYRFVAEIAMAKNLTIASSVYPDVYRNGYHGSIYILNDNSYVEDALSLFDKYMEFGG